MPVTTDRFIIVPLEPRIRQHRDLALMVRNAGAAMYPNTSLITERENERFWKTARVQAWLFYALPTLIAPASRLIGMASLHWHDGHPHTFVCVLKEHQGKGYSVPMLRHAMRAGHGEMIIGKVRLDNRASLAMHARSGPWVEVSRAGGISVQHLAPDAVIPDDDL